MTRPSSCINGDKNTSGAQSEVHRYRAYCVPEVSGWCSHGRLTDSSYPGVTTWVPNIE